MDNTEKSGLGAVVAIIIIVVLVLAGGWYFLSERSDRLEAQRQNTAAIEESEFSTSTEISDIEADLGKINFDILE